MPLGWAVKKRSEESGIHGHTEPLPWSMTDNRSRLGDIPPLGKSVEEIEGDSQNRVNPPALDGGGQAGDVVPILPPLNSTGTLPGTTGLGAGTPEVPTGPVGVPTVEDDRLPEG